MTNFTTRPIKRKLSRFEKSSIPDTSGLALVLPGSPGTEVEELLEAGFNPLAIRGVENDVENYDKLFSHYADLIALYNTDLLHFVRGSRLRGKYSYAHLDMCGHLSDYDTDLATVLPKLMSHRSRLRLTYMWGRKSVDRKEFESLLIEEVLLKICRSGMEGDHSKYRWEELWNSILDSSPENVTPLAALSMVIASFFLGASPFEVSHDLIKEPKGTHGIGGLKRYHYSDNNGSHMSTVWVNLSPVPNRGRPFDELYTMLSDIPSFGSSNFNQLEEKANAAEDRRAARRTRT